MRNIPGVSPQSHSTRAFPCLSTCLMLILVFLGSPAAVGQQFRPVDTLSVLEFNAQPRHRMSIMEGNRLVQENASNASNFQLSENQDYAVIEAADQVRKLPSSYQIPGNQDIQGEKYLLPFNLLTKLTNNSTVSLGVILINSTPMEIDDAGGQFKGNLVFRLLNRDHPSLPGEDLKHPVLFEIYSQELDEISPERIELNRTNTSSPEISCRGDHGLVDSVDVKIVTEFNPEGYVFHLNIKPYLEIESKKSTIQGMGVEEANMSLLLLGTTRNDNLHVSLDASLGSVDPIELNVYPDRPGHFKLRSAGLGKTVVTAYAPNIRTIEKGFTYVFPWLFIVMAIIGGVLGTLAKVYIGPTGEISLRKVLLGAAFGFIGAVAWYALGINLLSFELPHVVNEFGAMGVGALISLLGITSRSGKG